MLNMPSIKLNQFYGIELDDFAHEVAILSLWLAEHQMNQEFKNFLETVQSIFTTKDGGNIVCGNATRLDWEEGLSLKMREMRFIFWGIHRIWVMKTKKVTK